MELMKREPGLLRDWDEHYGDRMQKIVFIGQHLDKEQLIKDLDPVWNKSDGHKIMMPSRVHLFRDPGRHHAFI